MSDNIVPNNNTEEEVIESFREYPGFTKGDNTSKLTSFSALNRDNKNIHNQIFSDLPDTNKNINVKRGYKLKFDGNKEKIDSYFYNENPGDAGRCYRECRDLLVGEKGKKYNPCAAFEYNKSTKDCLLYNSIPNNFTPDQNFVSGNKVNYKFSIKNLYGGTSDNVKSRIGSQMIYKKLNIADNNPKNNLNKCLDTVYSKTEFKTTLVFYIHNGRWDGTGALDRVVLRKGNEEVCDPISLSGRNFAKGSVTSIDITWLMKSNVADNFHYSVGNDGVRIARIDFFLNFDGVKQKMFSVTGNRWVKRSSSSFNFPIKIDLKSLSFPLNAEKEFIGSGQYDNRIMKFDGYKNNELDRILKSRNWAIETVIAINGESRHWRNIFHYGNRNGTRRPAMWIWPRRRWLMHFCIDTNRRSNHYFNFWIPRSERVDRKKLKIRYEYTEYFWPDSRVHGFIISVSCNNKHIGNWNYWNCRLYRATLNNFYIKDPWYGHRNSYAVDYVKFSKPELIKMTTGRGRGVAENANVFNNMVKNLKPPFYFIRLGYYGYSGDYRYIVYKRLTSPKGIDFYKLFHTDWFNQSRGIRNKFNVDFELYSNIQDAKEGKGRWKFCNFNDPGIGFPRDCGINRRRIRGYQWQSKSRGGRVTWSLFLMKNQDEFVDLSPADVVKKKVEGYEADPYCVYKNTENKSNIYNSNLKAIHSHNDESAKEDAAKINVGLADFKEDAELMKELSGDMNDTVVNERLARNYLGEADNIKKANKPPDPILADITGLKKAVGKSTVMENFDNKSSCNTKVCMIALFVIICLVIFLILFRN